MTAPLAAALACLHCGEQIAPDELTTAEQNGQTLSFCCHGCRSAYLIINGAGLGSFYQRADRDTVANKEAFQTSYAEDYLAAFISRRNEQARISLIIDGIRCASCIWVIERVLQKQAGFGRPGFDCELRRGGHGGIPLGKVNYVA